MTETIFCQSKQICIVLYVADKLEEVLIGRVESIDDVFFTSHTAEFQSTLKNVKKLCKLMI